MIYQRSISVAFFVFFAGALFTLPGYSQTGGQVEVTQNVNLRPNPSTANVPIELIRSPEKLVLLEPDKTNGYYHVVQ